MAGSRKKDLVRDEVLHRLVTARYRYGERLLVKEISEETGVSRQPIMTALSTLSSEGFVNIVAQVGCEVISPSRRDIADFYLMFERLEGLMAGLAADRGSDQQIGRLKAINQRIKGIDPSNDEAQELYRKLNREFHSLIHTMASSPLLHDRQSNVFTMSDFFIAQSIGFLPHLHDAAAEHDQIIDALAGNDADAARKAMERHIAVVGVGVLAAMDV